MLKNRKAIHAFTFVLGLSFFLYAILSAVFLHNPRFYTLFALGAYFVLDFIDYKINKTSVMGFFLNRNDWYAFPIFLAISTVSCFFVDFILGVHITKMWEWRGYNTFDFVIMFLFMNASYVLGMYEIFRIVRSFFEKRVSERHLINTRIPHKLSVQLARLAIVAGVTCFVAPLWVVLSKSTLPVEFVMLLPFIGLMLIPDSITFLSHGRPIIPEILRLNLLLVLTLFFTVGIASFGTETLNLFSREWEYLRMPFSSLTVFGIPAAVFVGWVPLVVSTICIVTLAKHLTYIYDSRRK